jgi:hypothetical protein
LEGVCESLTTRQQTYGLRTIANTCQSAGPTLESGRIRKLATHALHGTRMCRNSDHLEDFWFSLS